MYFLFIITKKSYSSAEHMIKEIYGDIFNYSDFWYVIDSHFFLFPFLSQHLLSPKDNS